MKALHSDIQSAAMPFSLLKIAVGSTAMPADASHQTESAEKQASRQYPVFYSDFSVFSFVNHEAALPCRNFRNTISKLVAVEGAFIPSSAFCFERNTPPLIST